MELTRRECDYLTNRSAYKADISGLVFSSPQS
jgi:hypothetical protein